MELNNNSKFILMQIEDKCECLASRLNKLALFGISDHAIGLNNSSTVLIKVSTMRFCFLTHKCSRHVIN